MVLLYLITLIFGLLILVVLVTLFIMDDPGARTRLNKRLRYAEIPSKTSISQMAAPILNAIPVPEWFKNRVNSRLVTWSGIALTEDQFCAISWLASWLGLLLFIVILSLTSFNIEGILVGSSLLLAGFTGPYSILQRRVRVRRRMIKRALPDFLDMLTFTVEAGLGLVPALKRVTAGFEGPLRDELELALLQIDLGCSHRDALQELVRRVPIGDVEQLVEAILLAKHLGTSLARTLRIQANLLRTHRRQRAERQAQTAPIRIIPALVFFFLPSLLLIFLAPPLLNFLLHP